MTAAGRISRWGDSARDALQLTMASSGGHEVGHDMENDKPYVVSVLSGAHSGASISLAPGKYNIGQSFDADIVLRQVHVRPLHLSLELDGKQATLSCLDGAATVNGISWLQSKGQVQLDFPFDVSMDDTRLRVDGPERRGWNDLAKWPEKAAELVERYCRSPVLVILAILPISIYAIAAMATPTARNDRQGDEVLAMSTSAGRAAPSVDIIDALKQKVNAAGLVGLLQIDKAGDAITVRGKLTPDQMTHWLDIRRDIDGAYGSAYAFDSQIETVASIERPHLALQAIWAGPQAKVITTAGERLGEGSEVPGGWRIDKIEASQVTLSEGNQKVILTY